jgi:hypothetical protein
MNTDCNFATVAPRVVSSAPAIYQSWTLLWELWVINFKYTRPEHRVHKLTSIKEMTV